MPLLTGCGTKSAADPVAIGIAALASGGVAVQESYEGRTPIAPLVGSVSAMRMTRWQLRNMVGQASAGMGMLGAALDAFGRSPGAAPRKRTSPGIATFIGAWVKRSQGPLATYAGQFMPKNADYAHPAKITFPLLVVTLFIADAARTTKPAEAPTGSATGFEWERLIAAPASASGGCSTVTNFVASVVDNVTNALLVTGDGFLASLWNTTIAALVGIAVSVIETALAPIFSTIRTIATVLAMVTTIASSLQPWTVDVQPGQQSVTLLGTPVTGKFTATLHADSIQWPDGLKDCAQALANIDLDTISYVNAPVEWETFGDFPGGATVSDSQKTIQADKTAVLNFQTVPIKDEQKPECSTLHLQSIIIARAWIGRSDIDHLQAALANAALSLLPKVVQQLVTPLITPWIDALTHELTNLLAAKVTSAGTVSLMKNERDDAKCVSPPPAVPSAAVSAAASASPTPNPMVGNWACLIKQHVNVQGVSIDVDVHVDFAYGADGMAVARFPLGTTGTFGPGGGNVQADQKMTASAPGPYSYKATGTKTGILHFPTAQYRPDAPVTFASANTYSETVVSHESGKTYVMVCNRK